VERGFGWDYCPGGGRSVRAVLELHIQANIQTEITDQVSCYGRLQLVRVGNDLAPVSEDRALIAECRIDLEDHPK